jgi:hypothetical protein
VAKLYRPSSVLYRRGLALALAVASSACHDDRTLGEIVDVNLPGLCAGGPCDGWCERPPGACDAPSTRGICRPSLTPQQRNMQLGLCPQPDVRDFVCSCDGRSFVNDCLRLVNQASLFGTGTCSAPGCTTTADCAVGQFCDVGDGSCNGGGTCQPGGPDAPALRCDPTPRAFCGCDGQTYRSQCERHRAGVSILHDGPCGGMTPDSTPVRPISR